MNLRVFGNDIDKALENVGRVEIAVVVDVDVDNGLRVLTYARQRLHDEPFVVERGSRTLQNAQKDVFEEDLHSYSLRRKEYNEIPTSICTFKCCLNLSISWRKIASDSSNTSISFETTFFVSAGHRSCLIAETKFSYCERVLLQSKAQLIIEHLRPEGPSGILQN